MKRLLVVALLLLMLVAAGCSSSPTGTITPIDTGVDADAWVTVPAGVYPKGMHDHPTKVDHDYEIMVTDVTVEQYAKFLNEALEAGKINVGAIDVDSGYNVEDDELVAPRTVQGAGGYYPGDPYDGYKHEMQILPGEKLYVPLEGDGLRVTFDGSKFVFDPAYANHPMTMVSWYGANAYCEFYGWHLPTNDEWEMAARGTELDEKGHGLPFPWGEEIRPNNANYYASFDPFEDMLNSKLGTTTPVGFYNGKTYNGYQTLDSASPYGLYDMAGNVWQWTGDDFPDMHYRYLRGGSYYSYEVDLRVWKINSSGPETYEPDIGFRCARGSK